MSQIQNVGDLIKALTVLGYTSGGGSGGGVPGGADTQLQLNNAGAFGGASLWQVDAAAIRMGAADAAAPVAQSLIMQSVVAGTSNTAGVNTTLKGSAGTGTGIPGKWIFQTAGIGLTGSTQNAFGTVLTLDSFSLTGASVNSAVLINQTWNTSGIAKAVIINVTNTASAAGSLLQDWQISSSSVANIDKTGLFRSSSIGGIDGNVNPQIKIAGGFIDFYNNGAARGAQFTTSSFKVGSTYLVGFSSTADAGGTIDAALARNAAGVVEFNSGTAGSFAAWIASTGTFTAAAPTVAAGRIGFGGTVATTVGAAGGASALPALPTGYMIINVAGTPMKVPYYAN